MGTHKPWKTRLPIAILLLVASLVSYGLFLELQPKYWDKRIKVLCSEEAGESVGLRIHEQVEAPDHYLVPPYGDVPGDILVPVERRKHSESSPIVQRFKILDVLHPSSPRVIKYSMQIVRSQDQKVLGEEIKYARTGGGIPTYAVADSFSCPDSVPTSYNTSALISGVFLNHPIRRHK